MYSITRFGSIQLSSYNTKYTSDPVAADESGLIPYANGVWDSYGNDRAAVKFPQPLSYRAILYQPTTVALRDELAALRAAVGTRARLYRTDVASGAVQWCVARLMAAPQETSYEQRGYIEISLSFLQMTHWHGFLHGAGWAFDDGSLFDDALTFDQVSPITINTSPKSLTISNDGNLPVDDVVVTILAASSISQVILTAPNIELIWDGVISAGNALVIDAAAWSIKNDGENAYNNLTFGSQHRLAELLRFEPGSTTLYVGLIGGGSTSTISVVFSDRVA